MKKKSDNDLLDKNPDYEREKLLMISIGQKTFGKNKNEETLQSKVSSLQTNVSNLQTTVSSLGNPPTKTSDLTNDSGFVSESDLQNLGDVVDQISDDITVLQTNLNDLEIPTKTSDLTNDSGFLTAHQDISGKENTANKTTTIDENSTNTQYPTALAVFNLMEENMINTTDLENGIDDLNTTNTNLKNTLNDKLQALTVAVRGIGADFSQVDAEASDVKSGKKFFDDDGLLQTGTISTYEGSTNITENGTISTANKFLASDLTVAVSQPTLSAPTIAINNGTVTITNPATNGNFVTSYKVYSNNTLLCTTTSTSVDLTTYLSEDGHYSITVKCCGTNFEDSSASTSATYIIDSSASQTITYTTIAEISALNTTSDSSTFNTSAHEKVPFMSKGTNGPTAYIYFRQAPNVTLTPTIVLQLFLQNIPSGTTSLPCNIKLNGTVISSTALTVVSDQDYQATITLSNLTSLSFNKLEIIFNDSTLSTMQLDYVDITISNTQNCIILNRDDSFALSGSYKSNQLYSVYSTNYSDGFKYGIGLDKTFAELFTPTSTISLTDNSGNSANIAYAVTTAFNRSNDLTALNSYSTNCSIYYKCNNIRECWHYTTWNSDKARIISNAIQFSNSCHNGEYEYQTSEVNPLANHVLSINELYSVNLTYARLAQPVNHTFTLNSADLCSEFIGCAGVQDWFMNDRTVHVQNVGYFLIHKTGTILYFPRVNNSYCINIGVGKQVNAYLSQNGLYINVYYNRDDKVYKKTLSRTEITSDSIWSLGTETVYNDTKEICEWGNNYIRLNTSNTWSYNA